MVIVCSICQGELDQSSPPGSTKLTDEFIIMKTPNTIEMDGTVVSSSSNHNNNNVPNVVACSCGHMFHNSCATEWFITIGQRKCPICNAVTPATKMIKLYPSTTSSSNDANSYVVERPVTKQMSTSNLPSADPPSTTPPDPGTSSGQYDIYQAYMDAVDEIEAEQTPPPLDIEQGQVAQEITVSPPVVDEQQPSSSTSSTSVQMTEAIVKGFRTIFYRFANPITSSSAASTSRTSRERWRSNSRTNQEEQPDRSRSPRCYTCSSLKRVQILLERDLVAFRTLVAEQETTIAALNEELENSRTQEQRTIPNDGAGDSTMDLIAITESPLNEGEDQTLS